MTVKSKSGYVYLLLYPDGYKIGYSKKPWQRKRQLQGMHPARIYQVCSVLSADAKALEQELHNKYAMQRTDRREFFSLSDKQVSEVIQLGRMEIENLIIGIQTIRKYQPDADWYCQSQSFYCGEYNADEITKDELETMELNGWYEDEDKWCIDGSLPS